MRAEKRRESSAVTAVAALLAVATLAGCLGGPAQDDGVDTGTTGGGDTTSGGTTGQSVTFKQAGSSTVLPVAQAWAEEYERLNRNVKFVVAGGGTGAGFKQFCRGDIDISDASRPIDSTETATCAEAGVNPFEIPVAIDGLAIVVSTKNTFADHLTVTELNAIWTANTSKQANKWSDLRPEWPDEPIVRYGPGTDSGTFDYFIEVIIHPFDGKMSKGRSDYTPSEDDNVLVQGVAASPYALGYFGLAYVTENTDKIKAVPVDREKGDGPVFPTPENVVSGKYSPLSRPIFMYTDGRPSGELQKYFEWGLGSEGQGLVSEVGYIPLDEARRTQTLAEVRGG